MSFFEIFYPKKHINNVLDIEYNFLQENGIEALLLDIDNTLIDYDNNLLEGLENWVENLKRKNIKFCILSNTNKKRRSYQKNLVFHMCFLQQNHLKEVFIRQRKF